MLFVIGLEVGNNPTLIESLGSLGIEAFIITLFTTLCCGIGSLAFWRIINGKEKRHTQHTANFTRKRFSLRGLWEAFHESLIIFICFSAGCLMGYFGIGKQLPEHASFYTLCLLLICVGISIGQNGMIRQQFSNIKKSYMLMPLITIAGTWLGAILTAVIYTDRSLFDWLSVSSGFGYYSLSSILITEVRGIELGTIALIHNVMRELTALLFAPFLFKAFGPLAPISIGGATTADTTLPTISRVSGVQFVPVAIFHGLIVDLSVPLLIALLC